MLFEPLVAGELAELLGSDVVQEQVISFVGEIALNVLLEVVAINDDRFGRLGLGSLFGLGLVLGAEAEKQLFAIGRQRYSERLSLTSVSWRASPPRRSRTQTWVPLAGPGRSEVKER